MCSRIRNTHSSDGYRTATFLLLLLPARCCAPLFLTRSPVSSGVPARTPAHAFVPNTLGTRTVLLIVSSEDLCQYRYQFDNRIELTATWDAADGDGLEGQVSVTQVSGGSGGNLEDGAVAKLQISVFLTAASRC